MPHIFTDRFPVEQGKLAEAELLFDRSLAVREKVLGPEHLDVTESLNNCAIMSLDQVRTRGAPSKQDCLKSLQRPCSCSVSGEIVDCPRILTFYLRSL